jgi:hypothetical protein
MSSSDSQNTVVPNQDGELIGNPVVDGGRKPINTSEQLVQEQDKQAVEQGLPPRPDRTKPPATGGAGAIGADVHG